MGHPFFDATAYPWHIEIATTVHAALAAAYKTFGTFDLVYKKCAADLPTLSNQLNSVELWKQGLETLAGVAGALRKLCEVVLADTMVGGLALDAMRLMQAAKDPVSETVLAPGVMLLDREDLRAKVASLQPRDAQQRALLVRGDRRCGKTWSMHLVARTAASLGDGCIFLAEGMVGSVDEVIRELFAPMFGVLDSRGVALPAGLTDIPPRNETEDAYHKKVCSHLLRVAAATKQRWWIVIDDLGDVSDEAGNKTPRLDINIRKFFEQAVVNLANPAFAAWFRLVLLDYPDGEPAKWQVAVWLEDRPQAVNVDEKVIAQFLDVWGTSRQKRIEEEERTRIVAEIVKNAGTTADRLKTIQALLSKQLHDLGGTP